MYFRASFEQFKPLSVRYEKFTKDKKYVFLEIWTFRLSYMNFENFLQIVFFFCKFPFYLKMIRNAVIFKKNSEKRFSPGTFHYTRGKFAAKQK